MTKTTSQILILPRRKLLTHPNNMRRIYDRGELRQMAISLAANAKVNGHGNLVAMIVVPAEDKPGYYYVVDGNKRLAAGDILGSNCPPYKCEVTSKTAAEQLLSMSIANNMRSEPDIVSEGLHYARLIEQEGLSVTQIAQRTGLLRYRIKLGLEIARLDEPIQDLMASNQLPHDQRVVKALLALSDPATRIKVAQHAAKHRDSIKVIVTTCDKLKTAITGNKRRAFNQTAPKQQRQSLGDTPALTLGGPLPDGDTQWGVIRRSAKATCAACALHESDLIAAEPEPAYQLVAHATQATCATCNLRDLAAVCGNCPLTVMLQQLAQKQGVIPS